jgi:tetratricopeptide (TPR) repeat protein
MSRATVSPDTIQPSLDPRSRRYYAAIWVGAIALIALAAGCGGDVESRMQEIRALQDVGQFTESITELREVLAISPDLPEANYRLGAALVQTGDPSRAIWALKKASESEKFAVPAGLMLASAHFTVRDLEEVIRAIDRVLELAPERIAALQLRAKANLDIARYEEALADTKRLIEIAPDDYQNRAIYATVLYEMGRTEEAEAAHYLLREMGEASNDPSIRPRACIAPALFAKDGKKDLEEAESLYEECLAKYESDGFLVNHVMGFFDSIDKPERATELIRIASENAPENLGLRSSLARRLNSQGDSEAAEKVLVDAAETFDSAAAWNMLAIFYRRNGDSAKALGALEKVIELTGGGGDELLFMQADVLVDLEQYERAEEIVKSLDEAIYATLIRGRIQLANDEPAAALESFEKGIRHWPNNAGARYLAGVAAYELGDWERAITELREAMRADKTETNAARLLARIHFERGDFKQASNFASATLRRSKAERKPDDYVIAIRSMTKLNQFEAARAAATALSKVPDEEAAGIAELAYVARAQEGPAAAVKTLRESGLDLAQSDNQAALRAMADNLNALGQEEEALAAVDSAIAANPEDANLHAIRGTTLSRLGRKDEARQEFEKAHAIDADNASAIAGLAVIAGNSGDFAKAIKLFDLAAKSADDDAHAYSAAQLTLQIGDKDGAMDRLREIVRKYPASAGARNDLAWLLAESGGNLDTALSLAEEAKNLDPAPDILDTLGWVHIKRGEAAAAVSVLEKAHSDAPDSASIRYHLGSALAMAGDSERAREMLQSAVDTAGFEEIEEARRELAKLEP